MKHDHDLPPMRPVFQPGSERRAQQRELLVISIVAIVALATSLAPLLWRALP